MPEYKDAFIAGCVYHIFNRAVGSEKLFVQEGNYDYFLFKLQQYLLPVADIYCFCLLPQHFHLMLRFKEESQLQELKADTIIEETSDWLLQRFSNFFNAYTKALNKQQNRSGKLFEEPFRRRIITDARYYTAMVKYIHFNAVKHRCCKHLLGWPHHSYHQYLQPQSWLCRAEVWLWFDGKDGFFKFHQQASSF